MRKYHNKVKHAILKKYYPGKINKLPVTMCDRTFWWFLAKMIPQNFLRDQLPIKGLLKIYTRQGNTCIENGQINTDLYRFVQIYTLSVLINTCLNVIS
jgi:hypothetical protein